MFVPATAENERASGKLNQKGARKTKLSIMAASCIVLCRALARFFYGNDIRHTILEIS